MTKTTKLFGLMMVGMLAILFGVYKLTNRPEPNLSQVKLNQQATIYFHGSTCPNCIELSKWIKDNKIDQKVKYEKREVYYNKENATLLVKAASVCQIPNNQIGVPFIFDKGKCYMGIPEAQKILTQKAKGK